MRYPIITEMPPSKEHSSQILHPLHDYNRSLWPEYTYAEPYGFFIKDKNKVLGGAVGSIWIGALRIDRLFVAQEIRCQGYGAALLKEVEKLAYHKNVSLIAVENLSFQKTLSFYLKHGYTVVLEDEGYADNIVMYHLRRKLE